MVQVGGWFATAYLVPLWTLTLVYMFHTTGELMSFPYWTLDGDQIGSKVYDWHCYGSMCFYPSREPTMWQESSLNLQVAKNRLAVRLWKLTAEASWMIYSDVFQETSVTSPLEFGVFLILVSPLLNKLMHGVK